MLTKQAISLATSLPKSRRFFVKLRWGGRRVCPRCEERKLWRRKHHRISHGKGEYVSGRTHINGIEGFFSYAKLWLYHYRGVPSSYFHLYLKETEFRFNHSDEDIFPLIAKLLVKSGPDR